MGTMTCEACAHFCQGCSKNGAGKCDTCHSGSTLDHITKTCEVPGDAPDDTPGEAPGAESSPETMTTTLPDDAPDDTPGEAPGAISNNESSADLVSKAPAAWGSWSVAMLSAATMLQFCIRG